MAINYDNLWKLLIDKKTNRFSIWSRYKNICFDKDG